MSSEQPRRPWNSLSLRLTLWYTGIFTFCTLAAFLLFYLLIVSVIRERTDQELLGHAGQFSTLLAERGIQVVEELAILEAQAAGEKKVFFRLLYPTGQAFSSSSMSYWKEIAVHRAALEKLLAEGKPVFETVDLKARREQIRILYALIGPGIILQVGQSTENYARITDAFRRTFVITMALLIGLAAGVGWFMARRAVSGVEAIRRTAQGISGGTLERRVPVRGRGDEIDQLAMTFNRMLDRIQALVNEIKEMGDNIAHDLKSPLTRIRGNAEVTLTTGKTLAEYEALAAGTVEECDRLLEMINTMLMISRAEAGVERPVREPIDLAALLKEACELFGSAAEDKGLTLTCSVPGRCDLAGDTRMIQRMIANLIDNAIKYTDPGGKIEISLTEGADGSRLIRVKDSGTGIKAGELPRIFERFYRGDRSRSTAGTGLGLSLARAIARSHGGEVAVDSRPGEGSTFTVTLPRTAPWNPARPVLRSSHP
jgi:heavy metal sensor kinase